MYGSVGVQSEECDLAEEYRRLREVGAAIGAVVTVCGLVRDCQQQARIDSLTLQHYQGMTEASLNEVVLAAEQRWPLHGVSVIHRVGALLPSDQIVFVGVASSHRAAAFQAADFLMDYLKTHALLWKSVESDGQRSWVETKDSDQRALQRWTQSSTPP